MKKLSFFVATCLVALTANAAVVTLNPGDDINAAITAAAAGDVIELATGEYNLTETVKLTNALTLKATADAKPVVNIHRIEPNAEFAAQGIEFVGDGSSHIFRTTTGGDFSLRFEGCTFKNAGANTIIYLSSGQSLNTLTVTDCILDGSTYAEYGGINLYGTAKAFVFTNNTVLNISGRGAINIKNTASITIDHCTFYNNGPRPVKAENGDNYALVSNCVISNPDGVDIEAKEYCISVYNGAVGNCVYYNTQAPRSSAETTDVVNADPQFVDAENGNLNFSTTSPLVGKATDGRNIGDPRWKAEGGETALSATLCNTQAEKRIENGQVVIVREGVRYNTLGTTVK